MVVEISYTLYSGTIKWGEKIQAAAYNGRNYDTSKAFNIMLNPDFTLIRTNKRHCSCHIQKTRSIGDCL